MLKAAGALVLGLAISVPASAQGVVMVMNETSGGRTSQARMQLDRTHVRADIRDPLGQQAVVIFDAGAQVMRIINSANRTYVEMTRADLQQMGSMMAQMQETLKSLPPEQRKMMEDMMKGRGAGMPGMAPPPAPIVYKRTGTGTVGRWSCTTYDGYRGGEKVMEVCAAESGLDLTAADFQAVQQLADFMKSIAPQQVDQLLTYGTGDAQAFAGFPVRRVMFQNGRVESTSELAELRREAIPASAWETPAGFTRQTTGLGR